MAFSDPPRTEPTGAERIRTILAAAHSMTVVTAEGRSEVSRATGAQPWGRIHICTSPSARPDAEPDREQESAPWGFAAATLEFTDIAPTAVRDRVRARLSVTGWLAADDTDEGDRCFGFSGAVLETADGRVSAGLDELIAAQEDPLSHCEANMLTHLVDDHDDVVTLLSGLVDPRQVRDAARVVPLAVDRFGITLRLERARGHHDVRLPFASPLDSADQAGGRIHALLARARRRSDRDRSLSN
ncbi:DUF2470 domain-containing protein [Streptomyces sp. NBC_00829]|uniref:DUF2470 domain-containing protein n=1 Tax=Streptomyces sp. NBC_00829 TaxID=2903679 RepID=UPI003866BCC6|nr:DUF2470 domain-containing protein [Streptomyces sp. NBC_00829]